MDESRKTTHVMLPTSHTYRTRSSLTSEVELTVPEGHGPDICTRNRDGQQGGPHDLALGVTLDCVCGWRERLHVCAYVCRFV